MPFAYSEDPCWRIIWYKFLLMRSDEEVAFQLFVCPRTMQHICQKFVLTGNVVAERAGCLLGTTTLHRHEEYITAIRCILVQVILTYGMQGSPSKTAGRPNTVLLPLVLVVFHSSCTFMMSISLIILEKQNSELLKQGF